MPSRSYLMNVSTSNHLSNLLTELENADQNTRYSLEIAELKNGIRQVQSR